jgi:endonuclease/exonuclease/phosphatase family metal-dependent hydrolase
MTEIRVLSWNIRHGLTHGGIVNIESFVEEILKFDVDIILLQEVDRKTKRAGYADQCEAIKTALGFGWHGAWGTRTKIHSGHYGLATFSKYGIDTFENHLLSAVHPEKCIAQESTVYIKGSPITIVNLHMPYDKHTGVTHMETAWHSLNEIEFPTDLIAGGDLNVLYTTPEYDIMISECIDIGYARTTEHARIDYCMGRGRCIPTAQTVYPCNLSDHYPFITTFMLKPFEQQVYKN